MKKRSAERTQRRIFRKGKTPHQGIWQNGKNSMGGGGGGPWGGRGKFCMENNKETSRCHWGGVLFCFLNKQNSQGKGEREKREGARGGGPTSIVRESPRGRKRVRYVFTPFK